MFSNILRQFNLEPIHPNAQANDNVNPFCNLEQLFNLNSKLKPAQNFNSNNEFLLNTLLGNMNNIPMDSQYNNLLPNYLINQNFRINNNLINPQVNHHHYFQFIQNNNIGNLQIPLLAVNPHLINDQNLFMQFYLKNKNSFLPWLNACESVNTTTNTKVTNLLNKNGYNTNRNFNLSNLCDKVQGNNYQKVLRSDHNLPKETVITLPCHNDATIQIKKVNDIPTSFEVIINKKNLNFTTDDNRTESVNSLKFTKKKKKRCSSSEDDNTDEDFQIKNSNDYSFCPEKPKPLSYEENELELINRINYPRKLRANRMIKKSDIFNKQCSIKTQIAEFQSKYHECLQKNLQCKRHQFMHDHFPSMYEIENFYQHIHEMSSKRSKKTNILLNIQPSTSDKIIEAMRSRKIWSCLSLDPEDVNKYVEIAYKNWPIDDFIYNEECALEFLMVLNNDINEAVDCFKNKKHILIDFLNSMNNHLTLDKGINRKQVETVLESIDKKSRRIRLR